MGRIYLSAFGALFLVLPAFVYSATSLADNGNQIPIHLRHCYNTTTNYHRSFRSPMTFEALLSIIRKFESSPAGTNLGAKDVAAIIQHYVRFDGIEPAPVQSQLQQTSGIIPFAPSGNDFYSFNLVNTMFNSQPNQDVSILNNALTKQELCNLHFMVSHSIDANKRSDENCNVNVLAKVTKRRLRRAEREELDPKYQAEKVDFPKPSTGIAKASLRQAPSGRQLFVQRDRSACPVENGVIKTPTGVVAIGTVIAGIASGLLPQTVDLRQYLSTDELNQFPDSKLDNVWASTMGSTIGGMLINVGDLVSDYVKAIGLTGNFNESVNYQWYLLTADKPGYVTDAQLRGAMDGLWLGSKIKAFVDMNSNTKLSQILDMYYSDQGVGDVNVKSCNRKSSYADYSNDNDFYNEVGPFTVLLHKNSVNSATITDFTDFVTQTMGSVKSAINQVDGTQCANNNGQAATPDYALNLVVVIDNTWPGTAIKDIITVLAENQVACEPFLSNTTIICGRDGKILFQGRDYSNFTSNFTVDVLRQCAPGIDLSSSLYSSEVIFRNLFANEESSGQVTRGSSAILFLPYSQDSLVNSSAAADFRNNFVRYLPDVKFLVATNGPNSGYDGLVTESSTDVFTIRPPNSDPAAIADIGRIANALQTVPQRLAYPQCGTYYTPSSWGSGTLKDNVAINSIKYYKLPANYFYSISNQPRVSIQSTRGNQLTVCFSRANPQPSGDATVSNSGTNTGTNPNSRYNPNYPSNYNPSYGGNNPGYGSNNNPGYGGNSNPGYGSNNNPSYPDNSYYPNNNNPNNPNNNIYRNTYNNQPRRYNRQFSSLSTDDSTCISVNSAAQALALPENPCTGYYTISECPPFYISVSAPPTSSVPSGSCVSNCRYPSNAEYTITLENLSCDNGASSLLLNPIVLTIITFISVVRFLW